MNDALATNTTQTVSDLTDRNIRLIFYIFTSRTAAILAAMFGFSSVDLLAR